MLVWMLHHDFAALGVKTGDTVIVLSGKNRGKQGKVILQTRQANLPLIKQIVQSDYEAMYLTQVAERKAFGYPPFTRIINIYVKHRDERICVAAASHLATMLRPHFGTNLFRF